MHKQKEKIDFLKINDNGTIHYLYYMGKKSKRCTGATWRNYKPLESQGRIKYFIHGLENSKCKDSNSLKVIKRLKVNTIFKSKSMIFLLELKT